MGKKGKEGGSWESEKGGERVVGEREIGEGGVGGA